ncbi:MAG: 30S ribosomal protein S12 methylthiotransferase RimO [Clostridia bacterium]|nr:30S ribosomal protein S12 methylthiotransferase RimO [Clostridia bacterium]
MVNGKKIGVISLGCDKNRVDTEKMLGILKKRHVLTSDIMDADIVIINTCAFLEASRKESLNEILTVGEEKKKGNIEKIIVTGCLPQKFHGDLYDGLFEVDAFLGTDNYGLINEIIDRVYDGERVNAVCEGGGDSGIDRVLTTDNYVYLKIAEGCSNHCTYCLIPQIRGKYRSVKKETLIDEVKKLGVIKELILVAQDVTKYGEDLTPKSSLPDLIRSLSALDNVIGIRLLYCYPEGITDELIREFQGNAKMMRYIDIPFQHADDRILKLMNRKGSFNTYLNLVERLKREISGIAIRSTFIAGFPTEGEDEFNRLLDFIKKAKLFNAGFFSYSKEEGTPASKLDGQIAKSVKTKRVKKLYAEQKKVVNRNFKEMEGKVFSVLAEGFDEEKSVYYGRAYFNAPSIDGVVYFFSGEEVKTGECYNVKIIKGYDYDLYGERI